MSSSSATSMAVYSDQCGGCFFVASGQIIASLVVTMAAVYLSSSPTSVAVAAAVAVVRSSLAIKGSFVINENICGCGLDIDRGGGLCVVVGDISDRFLDIPCRSFLCLRLRHMWIYPRQWPQWRVYCRHR